jgi:hypothetical protein
LLLLLLPSLPQLPCSCCRSYPFEIHDDALVLKKMLEHEEMQQRVAGAAAAAAAGELKLRKHYTGPCCSQWRMLQHVAGVFI